MNYDVVDKGHTTWKIITYSKEKTDKDRAWDKNSLQRCEWTDTMPAGTSYILLVIDFPQEATNWMEYLPSHAAVSLT